MLQLELLDPDLTAPTISQPTTFSSNLSSPCHRWFRYSAGYSAEWCSRLIAEKNARVVFDPFVGSGTTLLAAQAVGARSLGVEAHPLIARIGRAKLLWSSSADLLEASAARVLAKVRRFERDQESTSALIRKIYSPESYCRLAALREAVKYEDNELLWLALVSILRECSPAGTAQWQYVLPDRKKSKVKEPYAAFADRVGQFVFDMKSMHRTQPEATTAELLQGDMRNMDSLPTDWADLVVTSPPYANNYDYADATRIEMSFLGETNNWSDLAGIRKLLIHSCSQQMSGYDSNAVLRTDPCLEAIRDDLAAVHDELAKVRLTRAGRKAYHAMAVAYFADLGRIWHSVRKVVKKGGACCWVVGDSAPYGVHMPVEEWLGRLALQAGFSDYWFEQARVRNVKWKNRKHRVPLQEGYLWVKG